MSDLNNLTIVGRLTNAPEAKTTKNGKPLATFSIANSTGFGEYEKTSFFNCTAWNKSAEYCCNHLGKGDLVSIAGQIVIETWESDNGKRSAPKIQVREINRLRQSGERSETKSEGVKKVEETFVNPISDEEVLF